MIAFVIIFFFFFFFFFAVSNQKASIDVCGDLDHCILTDSVDVVLSRQSAVKCLFTAMRQFPKKMQLLLQACKSLLRQTQLSGIGLLRVPFSERWNLICPRKAQDVKSKP